MIDEINALLPLLQSATNGAIWGVAMYFAYGVLKIAAVCGVIIFVVSKASDLIKSATAPTVTDLRMVDRVAYFFDEGRGGLDCYFSKSEFQSLLTEIGSCRVGSRERVVVEDSHIQKAIETLKAAKK